jgi:hypothetical protein
MCVTSAMNNTLVVSITRRVKLNEMWTNSLVIRAILFSCTGEWRRWFEHNHIIVFDGKICEYHEPFRQDFSLIYLNLNCTTSCHSLGCLQAGNLLTQSFRRVLFGFLVWLFHLRHLHSLSTFVQGMKFVRFEEFLLCKNQIKERKGKDCFQRGEVTRRSFLIFMSCSRYQCTKLSVHPRTFTAISLLKKLFPLCLWKENFISRSDTWYAAHNFRIIKNETTLHKSSTHCWSQNSGFISMNVIWWNCERGK